MSNYNKLMRVQKIDLVIELAKWIGIPCFSTGLFVTVFGLATNKLPQHELFLVWVIVVSTTVTLMSLFFYGFAPRDQRRSSRS